MDHLPHVAPQTRPLPSGRQPRDEDPAGAGLRIHRAVAVQRSGSSLDGDEPGSAERAGGRLSGGPARSVPFEVDVEALAQRVYELMRREILTEHERRGRSWC